MGLAYAAAITRSQAPIKRGLVGVVGEQEDTSMNPYRKNPGYGGTLTHRAHYSFRDHLQPLVSRQLETLGELPSR